MYDQYVPGQDNGYYHHFNQSALDEYDIERQAPSFPPPQQFSQQIPQAFFSNFLPTNQIRSLMCGCLGRWGLLGLRFQSPFGRDIWFFPTEIRQNSVSGYTWQSGRSQRVSYNYSQIRNFICT